MFGCFRNAWIFNSLINWSSNPSATIFFFYTTFIASIKPVVNYLAMYTFPNFPYPNFFNILNPYRSSRVSGIFLLSIAFDLDFRKAGFDFFGVYIVSAEVVEDVYFKWPMTLVY